MATKQPQWKCIANLGDVNPLEYGGLFVYVDRTGQYPPEMELIEPLDEYDGKGWETRRVCLDPCTYQTPDDDGAGPYAPVLSDNRFHPTMAAWFAEDLPAVANCMGQTLEDLISGFTSADPIARAHSWRAIGDYHGWSNLDSYPNRYIGRKELPRRFTRGKIQNGGR